MATSGPQPGMVEDYEALRRVVLARQAGGPQLGRAVVERAGVAAWAEAWSATSAAPGRQGSPPRGAPPPAVSETVSLLAGMALAVVGAGR